GRGLVLAFDLDGRWSDFPKRAAFVPFLDEAVGYLEGGRRTRRDYLVSDLPPGLEPKPGIATLPAGPARGAVRPTRIAVNVDPRESNPARISADEFKSALVRIKRSDATSAPREPAVQEDLQHLWRYLLLMAAAFLAIEGIVAARAA